MAQREMTKKEKEQRDIIMNLIGALSEIAAYGSDGICPYGCDTPAIAIKALSDMGLRPPLPIR